MILPKTGDKSDLYLQVQNQLRLQNRQLILQLCRPEQISTDKVDPKKRFQVSEKKKKVKKTFEDATTNTDGSCSDDGYRFETDTSSDPIKVLIYYILK